VAGYHQHASVSTPEPPAPPVPPSETAAARGKGTLVARWRIWISEQNRALLPIIFSETAPLDLRIVGRMLFHAALVGVAAGVAGALFFGALEYVQRFLLEELVGYVPLRASGETFAGGGGNAVEFRPWLLVILPAIGGLFCGMVTRVAPESRGGGADATIE